MAGKGDTPRPVNQKKFADNWDRIFSKNLDSHKDWYLVAISPWHKWYYNPTTGQNKYTRIK